MALAATPDFLACLWAVVGFSLVLLFPGYLLGWTADLLGFRERSVGERAVWAVVLSFCVTPVAAELVGKFFSLDAVCWIAGSTSVGCVAAFLYERRRGSHVGSFGLGRSGRIALGALAVWALVAIVDLIDIPSADGRRLFTNVAIYDHALRTAFVDAVVRTGVPPVNPLYWPGHAVPMRYYYFWYIPCAVVVRLAHVGARTALIASCIWSGFGVTAVLALFLRYFRDEATGAAAKSDTRRQTLIGLALLAVTGLDILPWIGCWIAGYLLGDTEWWAWDQVTSWFDTFLWAPHHAAALVCCMTGFLSVWMSAREPRRWAAASLAGVAFASAFGLSIWVALGFAILMFGWMISLKDMRRVVVLLGAGAVAVVLLLPFLHELRTPDPTAVSAAVKGRSAGPEFLTLGARPMIPPDLLQNAPGYRTLWHTHPWLEQQLAMLTLMPLGYAIELGFFGLVFVAVYRRRRALGEADNTALGLAFGCLLLTSFVRSTVIANNDFGVRVTLVAQFFLLVLAARTWDEWRGGLRIAMVSLAAMGVVGTVTQVAMLRVYLPIEDALGAREYAGLGERAAAFHAAFRQLDGKVPASAVIAYLPDRTKYFNFVQTLYLQRQAVNEWPECNLSFGGSAQACDGIERDLTKIYEAKTLRGISAQDAQALCRGMHADYLSVSRWDGVWKVPDSWVWTLPTAVATDSVRIMSCESSP